MAIRSHICYSHASSKLTSVCVRFVTIFPAASQVFLRSVSESRVVPDCTNLSVFNVFLFADFFFLLGKVTNYGLTSGHNHENREGPVKEHKTRFYYLGFSLSRLQGLFSHSVDTSAFKFR